MGNASDPLPALGVGLFDIVPLQDHNATLYINYLNHAPFYGESARHVLAIALEELEDAAFQSGDDQVLKESYTYSIPATPNDSGCSLLLKNYFAAKPQRLTYGILVEVVDILYERIAVWKTYPYVSYLDILEGTDPNLDDPGVRIGVGWIEEYKPGDLSNQGGSASGSVATS